MATGRRGGPKKPGGRDDPTVTRFKDHDVIVPRNTLRKAWARPAVEGIGDDPVAAAEKALAALSGEFAGWMESECVRLDEARAALHRKGFDAETRQALYHACHDIKGQGATFGYPHAATAAASLCRLIDRTPDARRIPLVLVDQHVDAVRAIVREHGEARSEVVAEVLTTRLREVTDEFLRAENGGLLPDDDEVLSPPTVPGPR